MKSNIDSLKRVLENTNYNYRGILELLTSDFNKIKLQKEEAKSKGYSSCFIVAFKNGIKIPVDEALKTTSN